MRMVCCCAFLITWVPAAHAGEETAVQVFVPPARLKSSAALFTAEKVAARIFSDAGITLKWKMRSRDDGCAKRPWRIVIHLSWSTPADVRPGSVAQARPFVRGGVCVILFMDRIERLIDDNPALATSLLGHVLAHEIAHVLRGSDSHSETGLMKPSWSAAEIRSMTRKPLRFTELDTLHLLDSVLAHSPP